MKLLSLLTVLGCTAALSFTANAAELVTNGTFSAGAAIFGGSPTDWNSTVGAGGTGQFSPGGLQAPLSGQVAYMNSGTQIFQTFSIGLTANTAYTISFDSYISVSDGIAGDNLSGAVAYGTGSGGSSAFAGGISLTDVLVGNPNFSGSLTTTAQSYSFSFTTAPVITGSANNLAIYLNPGFTVGEQLYLDNVSVTTTAVPEPSTWVFLSAGVCAIVFFFRRRKVA